MGGFSLTEEHMVSTITSRLERVTSVLLTAAAITIAVLYARRELFPGERATAREGEQRQAREFIEGWNEQAELGVSMGPAKAPVVITMLSDFECPACRGFHKTLREARRSYPDEIRVSYVHYPLSYHRFAEPAARVSECANVQGRFEAMHDLLFEKQDSLGLKPWRGYAEEAGITDVKQFEACVSERGRIPRVDAGLAFGDRINAQGTPTVLVNGWLLNSVPSLTALEAYVMATRAGKPPISGNR